MTRLKQLIAAAEKRADDAEKMKQIAIEEAKKAIADAVATKTAAKEVMEQAEKIRDEASRQIPVTVPNVQKERELESKLQQYMGALLSLKEQFKQQTDSCLQWKKQAEKETKKRIELECRADELNSDLEKTQDKLKVAEDRIVELEAELLIIINKDMKSLSDSITIIQKDYLESVEANKVISGKKETVEKELFDEREKLKEEKHIRSSIEERFEGQKEIIIEKETQIEDLSEKMEDLSHSLEELTLQNKSYQNELKTLKEHIQKSELESEETIRSSKIFQEQVSQLKAIIDSKEADMVSLRVELQKQKQEKDGLESKMSQHLQKVIEEMKIQCRDDAVKKRKEFDDQQKELERRLERILCEHADLHFESVSEHKYKIDVEARKVVDRSTIETFANANESLYFETSAKTGEGVKEMFSIVTEKCVMNRKRTVLSDPSEKYFAPFLDEYPLCDIETSRVKSTEGYSQSKLVKFFQGKTSLSLTPDTGDVNLRIPFKEPHIISHFYISSQNIPSGIKRFKMHFTTVEKKLYVKEFSVSSDIPFDHYFWEKFIVEISVPIIACYLEVLSPDEDDKQPKVHLHAIRFVIDKEMEKLKAEEKLAKIEKLRLKGEARRAAEVKEERRVEINELLSDFISSTKQTLSALRDDLDATKKELSHTKAELEAEKTLRIQENEEFEKQLELKQAQMDSLSRELSMHQQTSETKRLILSRDIRSLQRELLCVSARVSGQPSICSS
ncbi:Small GTPase like protein, partial [Aduncisulcus paluster]